MQIKSKYSWMKHIDFIIVDLLALFLSFVISFYLKFNNLSFGENDEWRRYIFIILILSLVINFITNPYSGILKRSYYMDIIRALQLAMYNLLFASAIFYALKIGANYSREMSFVMYGIYFFLSLFMKFGWKKLLVSGKIVINTTKQISLFVICSAKNVEKTINNIVAGDFQLYDIKGIHLIDDSEQTEIRIDENNQIPIVKQDYDKFILDRNIGEVLVAVTPGLVENGILEKLNKNGIGLNIVVEKAVGFQPEDQNIQNIGVYKALSVGSFSFTPGQILYFVIKRLIDIIIGTLGVLVLIPITAFIKIAYILNNDRGKIFYKQKRVGQNGKIIYIWKFRSMVSNADAVLKELLKEERYRKEWEENQKLTNDPRITKIGRILRKTSIDELPQMINVLKGDMSLVGPRPLIVGELEQHGGLKLYERVKPGITGWWGCNGRSNIAYRERLELEYYYVKNCSLYLDILCIARTALAIVKRDGAQ